MEALNGVKKAHPKWMSFNNVPRESRTIGKIPDVFTIFEEEGRKMSSPVRACFEQKYDPDGHQ